MRFFAVLASLGIQSAAVALAAPNAAPSQVESIANATALGIDVWGPIPDDAVKIRDGYYTADPGTKAWAWIRAQIDLGDDEKPSQTSDKRQTQYANIGVGMFVQDLCTGQAAWIENVQYGVNYYTEVNMFSVGLSRRGLRDNEQLDFSRGNGFNYCGNYVYTAAKNTPAGCFNSQLINCFHLLLTN